MTAAGIIYSIARDCSRGQLKGCGCRNSTHSGTIYGNASFPVHCLDNLVYAEKVAAEFLQSLELESKDSTAAINLHNFVVGKEVSCYKGSIVHTLVQYFLFIIDPMYAIVKLGGNPFNQLTNQPFHHMNKNTPKHWLNILFSCLSS